MSTPFLTQFAFRTLKSLIDQQLLEVEPERFPRLVEDVAAALGRSQNQSLISTLVTILVKHPAVIELYADNAQLIEAIEGIGPIR